MFLRVSVFGMLPVKRLTVPRRKFWRLVKRNSPPKREYEKPSK